MDAIWTCRLAIVAAIVGQSAYAQNAPGDPVRVLVGRLDLDTYKATIKGLTQFGDRRQGTARNRAAIDWIEAQLKSDGCTNTERIRYAFTPRPPGARGAGAVDPATGEPAANPGRGLAPSPVQGASPPSGGQRGQG